MPSGEKFEVPAGFKKLVEKQLDELQISLREVARRSNISVSFISRILMGERNLPSDEDIIKLAKALKITPPERLLIEAKRVPKGSLPLLRATSDLSAKDIQLVIKAAKEISKKSKSRG